MPRFRLPLFLLLFPVAEIAAFVEIGSRIGAGMTVLWVVVAAAAGMVLLRLHGLSTMRRIQESMMRGELPARAMFDGALLFVSAVLLILPGFISDAVAILLLLPPVRWLIARMVMRRATLFARGYAPGPSRDTTIEGEYQREDEIENRPRFPR